MTSPRRAVLATLVVLALLPSAARSQITFTPTLVALSGTSAPGTAGAVYQNAAFNFANPVINNAGTVVFFSNLTGSSTVNQTNGLFSWSTGTVSPVLLRGDLAPPNTIPNQPPTTFMTLIDSNSFQLNDAGQVLVRASVQGGDNRTGLFQNTGGVLRKLYLNAETAPGATNATFGGAPGMGSTGFRQNAAGQVAFTEGLTDFANTPQTQTSGLFLSSGGRRPRCRRC
jgi:hypothetical protein